MGYSSIKACVDDLERHGHLVRIEQEINPQLEAAEIQRRVYRAGGPALYFARVKGSQFPMVSNLFGTIERARFMFRDAIEGVRRLIELKVDPEALRKRPLRYLGVPLTGLYSLPRMVSGGPVLANTTSISKLPQLKSWPDDGGAFITLPQVFTEDPDAPGATHANLGMYRIQLSGGRYEQDREIGLHYQIHRGIGVHHAAALRRGEPLKVSIFVGGPPAMTLAAVMPLPEGLAEIMFGGALTRRRARMTRLPSGHLIHADADFCIVGEIDPNKQLPEGPFGDHLGYYSLAHDFPVLRVQQVFHRKDAVWPFTVVGRPPQEDTTFGELIHDLTGPVIPTVLPGVRAVNAVDATGVHPLLLAIGSERYVPYAERREPQELLTQANAILGQGQMSLAKYLLIAAEQDNRDLDIHDVGAVLQHVLARFDPRRDLHFQTQTTIDTLDYSGSGLNRGSKLVIAAVGEPLRTLGTTLPTDLRLPMSFSQPRLCMPGVIALNGPTHAAVGNEIERSLAQLCEQLSPQGLTGFPLIVIVDDSDMVARSIDNFLWVTFTRSNPAIDIHGVSASVIHKHWGCTGPIVIDARIKSHHAPPLIEDPEVTRRVDALAAHGGPLYGLY